MNQPPPAPPRKLLFIPALLAFLAISIATLAAIAGQQARRDKEDLRIAKDIAIAQSELTQAVLQNAAPPVIDKLQQNLDDQKARQPVSYAQPGRHFTNWDAYRYEEIVLKGYAYHQPSDPFAVKDDSAMGPPRYPEKRLKNVVWYPLYPALGWLISKLLSVPAYIALAIVSQSCITLASILFFLFARRYYIERNLYSPNDDSVNHAALLAVTTLLFAPCSVFFYANFTESIFVLLLVAFLYCMQSGWWFRAAIIAAIASSSRSQGVLFGPILAVVYLVRSHYAFSQPFSKKLAVAILLGFISSLGLLAYMLFLQSQFHDPLAFMHAQKYWNVGLNSATLLNALNPLNALNQILRYAFHTTPMDWPRLWEALCLLWPPIILLVYRRKLSLELTIIGWMLWALPYVSNGLAGYPPGDSKWMSMGRFMAVMIPIQIILGELLAKNRRFALFFLLASACIFTLFALKFGAGEWIG